MKTKLAMRLLADLMDWDDEGLATAEFSRLALLVEAKYDYYQGYSPGALFFSNLLSWIGQFKKEDRKTAYNFLRERLIYISQREMHHLVGLTMSSIEGEMRRQVASELKTPYYRTWGNTQADTRLRVMGIRTLYVGLSDGAKTDVFRRENEGNVSNEQVVAASEISDTKWEKLTKELRKRLDEAGFGSEPALFERICLLDDFTASGTTLIRCEDKKWSGKIPTFCQQNIKRVGIGNDKAIAKGCWIHAHHYLATNQASLITAALAQEFQRENDCFNIVLTFSYVLNSDIVINEASQPELAKLLTAYYDPSVEDDIVGNNIWFGYKQGGLPLVLYHNTPNNSIALLWASSTDKWVAPAPKMKPLFSRKKRHIGHG